MRRFEQKSSDQDLFIAHCVTCKVGISVESWADAEMAAQNHAMKRLIGKQERHFIEVHAMIREKAQEVVVDGRLHR